jgi:hypothetical protein
VDLFDRQGVPLRVDGICQSHIPSETKMTKYGPYFVKGVYTEYTEMDILIRNRGRNKIKIYIFRRFSEVLVWLCGLAACGTACFLCEPVDPSRLERQDSRLAVAATAEAEAPEQALETSHLPPSALPLINRVSGARNRKQGCTKESALLGESPC